VVPDGARSEADDLRERLRERTAEYQDALDTVCSLLEDRQRILERSRELLARLVDAEERERKRIAQELHDDPLQMLATAAMRLDLVRSRLATADLGPQLSEPVVESHHLVRTAIRRLRTLMFDVGSGVLEQAGLADAIRMELLRLDEQADLVTALADDMLEEPPTEVRTLVYRICREALVNVTKHALAHNVRVALETRDHGCYLLVHDDGDGFSVQEAGSRRGHVGMTSMRERAEGAGGWFRVTSHPGGGTMVEAWTPIMASAVAVPAPAVAS
jgi:signal transduction histidine kinase